ncbi:GNAT family N-acetyltransferase [Paenibacillus allorhizosphaerae]|uniref:N-acetyltransferase domain-containing protein n=1 Tax=Paenibacillus allorhizosphaerae TaxID=2849866 RepID=A0ABM8VIX0_9BACL|nr:GNAT family N-acetyltransferase [Paenibacillus allorhizosphaerae]CAG7644600.1 hypothetical protein PAECIP111802_03327 [Paenibacillus allorhizosphaerae]
MMVQFRTARPEDIPAMVALSDRVFRKPHQTSMGQAYSLLFSNENAGNMLIAEEDGKIVTVVGLLPSEISIAGCTLRVLSMGSVCTDADYRGKDYAGTLVRMSIEKCEREGVHLLLVSGNRTLYRRNGCYEAGLIRHFTPTAEQARHAAENNNSSQAETVEYDEARDLESMLRLVHNEPVHYVRTKAQFARLIHGAAVFSNSAMNQHIALRRSNGEALAYVVYGLPGYDATRTPAVIEYAGSDQAVLELLRDVMERHQLEKLRVPVGGDKAAFGEALAAAGASVRCEPIPGTIRLTDLASVWRSLAPYIHERLGSETAGKLDCTRTADGQYRIAYGEETLALDARGALTLLFSGAPWAAGDALGPLLASLFPLPFVYTNNLNYV